MYLKRVAKQLGWRFTPGAYRRLHSYCPQEFAIGIATGPSPFTVDPLPGPRNPALTREDVTDIPAMAVADPFMCLDGSKWHMFFEVVNHLTRKGEIGLAISADAERWEYQRIVLAEDHHLSYPYVFDWRGAHYMIPESACSGSVPLYEAVDFPYRWKRISTLLEGGRFVDSSIVFFEDRWWLFTDAGEPTLPELRLFVAKTPLGPWREHPSSPIRKGDPHRTRPAGRLVVLNDAPLRFAQDVYPVYGRSVHAFRVTKLTPSDYEETPVSDEPVLGAGSDRWNEDGMHHIDPHPRADGSWIACVDGFRLHGSTAARTRSRPPSDVRASDSTNPVVS